MSKVLFALFLVCFFSFSIYDLTSRSEVTNQEKSIGMRTIGHEILLKSGDSTSRVLPIKQISEDTFEIHFENQFVLDPDALFEIINKEGVSDALPEKYFVNVLLCGSKNIQYAYEYPLKEGKSPPCIGRKFPKNCYYIAIVEKQNKISLWYYLSILPLLLFFGWKLNIRKSQKKQSLEIEDSNAYLLQIGTIQFYPSLQKLKIDNKNIALTAKESCILQIFAENINKEITRERLQKEIWEDKGVIVGRSLDVFISKLRKKLNQKSGINIVSIHGKGYKLTVSYRNY
jgi:hypothetical protein